MWTTRLRQGHGQLGGHKWVNKNHAGGREHRSDRAGGYRCQKMLTTVGWLRLLPVRIDGPGDDEDDGGVDPQSPTVGWLENGRIGS